MAIKYTQKVIQEFTNPQNVGEIADADAVATEGSPACGDMITYNLKIDKETRVVEDIKFRSYGCASNIATASVATKLAIGKTVDEILEMTPKAVTEELEGLPAVKIHCSVLAINGLKSAVRQWKKEHLGEEPEDKIELNKETVVRALRDVIHPETGISIVKMNMVRIVEVDQSGSVFVELMMGETDEMFFENIEEEAREHLEAIPGVKDVIIKITEGKPYKFDK